MMTIAFRKGRYGVRMAGHATDIVACQALRHRCFFGRDGQDDEPHDARCDHLMIADRAGLVATCRLLHLASGRELASSYAAQRYDLKLLSQYPDPMLELGRFCIAPRAADADVLRLLWGALTQIVDARGTGMLFGCTSFQGVDPGAFRAGFGVLAARYTAPAALAPGIKASEVVSLDPADCTAEGRGQLPPLLRSYLSMGGWVSDHAVIDRHMQTMHVFTALETARVPPRRAAALRAVAG